MPDESEKVYFLQKHLQYDFYWYTWGKIVLEPPLAQRKVFTAVIAFLLAAPLVGGVIVALGLLTVATRSMVVAFLAFVIGGMLLGLLFVTLQLAYQGADHQTASGMTRQREILARLAYFWRVIVQGHQWSTGVAREIDLDESWKGFEFRVWSPLPESRWLGTREQFGRAFRDSVEYRSAARLTGEAGRDLPAPRHVLAILDDWEDPMFARLRETWLARQREEVTS